MSTNRVRHKIYLAGRIQKNDWRDRGARSEYTNGDGRARLLSGFLATETRFGEFSFTRTGPFFVGCDHGCGHGPGQHGVGITSNCIDACDEHSREDTRAATVDACLAAIKRSDVVFAWLEPEAYGTVAELGYAKALDKDIYCARPDSVNVDDLWFAQEFGRGPCLAFPSPVAALTSLLKHLWRSQNITDVTESPIEALFMCSLRRRYSFDMREGVVVGQGDDFKIFPQHKTLSYRLDFALVSDSKRVAVELDGHAFHERTKEQAQRDKKRDRELQAAGWSVLRFTGSEVYADADKCVAEAVSLMGVQP